MKDRPPSVIPSAARSLKCRNPRNEEPTDEGGYPGRGARLGPECVGHVCPAARAGSWMAQALRMVVGVGVAGAFFVLEGLVALARHHTTGRPVPPRPPEASGAP